MKDTFAYGAQVALAYVSWLEFALGSPCTDVLGRDNDYQDNEKNLLTFELLYRQNDYSYDTITSDDVFGY